jgi:CheY-like chemotaxis protein
MTNKNVFMLIDDDEDDRDIFLSVLTEIAPNVECLVGTNGHDGLTRLRNFSDLPKLIFLDLNMPLMDGKQFLIEIKKTDSLKNIPVVILSTSSDRDTIAQTRALGAIDFITKPDRYSEWEAVLKKMIQ